MILEEFDHNKLAVFNPTDIQQKKEGFPEVVVGFFLHDLLDEFIKVYKPEKIFTIKSYTTNFDIYKITSNGVDIAVMQAPLGAPYSVSIFEEVAVLGGKYFFLAGSCGCLDNTIGEYSIFLPISAIRDEGTSYHYAPASDEIELQKDVVESIEKTLNKLKIPFAKGKTWTTDALYRETPEKVKKRKEMGAITVDMECSAMTAFAQFKDLKFGELFYGADDLSSDKYDVRSLIQGELSKQAKIIPILIKCAEDFYLTSNKA